MSAVSWARLPNNSYVANVGEKILLVTLSMAEGCWRWSVRLPEQQPYESRAGINKAKTLQEAKRAAEAEAVR